MSTTESIASSQTSLSSWRKSDTTWTLGLFGTAIGAGVLFFPIRAGFGGLIPILVMLVLAYPIAFYCHRALARLCLSGANPSGNITETVEEHFGKTGGVVITFLYFFAICPLLWIYGVTITNTFMTFWENQLQMPALNRGVVALLLLLLMAFVIWFGKDLMVKVMSYLVWPFIASLVVISLSLIPYWNSAVIDQVNLSDIALTGHDGILVTVWLGISIMVFSFNFSPIVSSFVVSKREEYEAQFGREYTERKCSQIISRASMLMVAVVMAGRLALSLLLQSHRGKAFIARFEGADDGVYVRPPGYRSRLRWIIPLLVGLAIVFPFLATKYLLTVAILGLIYVLLGLGLNIVVGLAGLLDLGYVAFYAIGAYGLALGYQYLGLGFWAMLPLGAVMAALAGALLGFPVLRMHGDYLAIVTLGFGEIIRLVLNNWVSFTGGPNGVPVPSPTLFGLEFTRRAKDGGIPIHEFFHVSYNPNLKFIFLYAVLCLVMMLVLLVKHRLTRMPIGRAWEALREDEIACRAMGLNHVLVKLSAFMLGASTAGIAGVFFASYQGFVNPTSFTFFESALILAIVVLGGMGSTLGVVLAAFVLTVTPELLRGFDEYRVLLFGVLMVMMMIWRPRGLVRTSRSGVALRKGVAP